MNCGADELGDVTESHPLFLLDEETIDGFREEWERAWAVDNQVPIAHLSFKGRVPVILPPRLPLWSKGATP